VNNVFSIAMTQLYKSYLFYTVFVVSRLLPRNRLAIRNEPPSDASILTQFSGFYYELPGDDELLPGGATLFWLFLCWLVQESLRLLEFGCCTMWLMSNAIN